MDQINYLMFHLLDSPAKCSRHSFEFDGRKWLEVQDQCTAFNQVREVLDMRSEMNVDEVSCLMVDEMSGLTQSGGYRAYRVSFEEF